MIKKILLLSLLGLSLSSCGPTTTDPTTSDPTSDPTTSESIPEGMEKYSVQVLLPDGSNAGANIRVQWCFGSICQTANTDENGYAYKYMEDQEYELHLFSLPENTSFKPSSVVSSSANREIEITLTEKLPYLSGDGSAYDTYLVKEGVYEAIVNPDAITYYGFTPIIPGIYKIESWIDVSALINAEIAYYGNNQHYVPEIPGLVGDPTENGNFELTLNVGESFFNKTGEYDDEGNPIFEKDEDGNLVLGSPLILGISANVKREKTFDFEISYVGEYEEEKYDIEKVEVKETKVYPDYTGSDSLTDMPTDGSVIPVFNENDGFYHVNSVDGPVLVVYITFPCDYLDTPISLTVDGENVGLTAMSFLLLDNGTKDYTEFVRTYETLCNSDGVYGVNEELKLFLELYHEDEHLWLESSGLVAPEGFGWLFATGFYGSLDDVCSTPTSGDGSVGNPFEISLDERYCAKIVENSSVFYKISNTKETKFIISSKNPNAKFVVNDSTSSLDDNPTLQATTSADLIIEVSTLDGKTEDIVFNVIVFEEPVNPNEIQIGRNTVLVKANDLVECTIKAPSNGSFTLECDELNVLIYDINQNEYSATLGVPATFSEDVSEGATFTFYLATKNLQEDLITFVISFQAK